MLFWAKSISEACPLLCVSSIYLEKRQGQAISIPGTTLFDHEASAKHF